jgi:hypothetical protein
MCAQQAEAIVGSRERGTFITCPDQKNRNYVAYARVIVNDIYMGL